MFQRCKINSLVLSVILLTACEDATIDYASDVAGMYKVIAASIDGIETSYVDVPDEELWIIDITSDDFLSYQNEVNFCDSTYGIEMTEIESITDTTIVLTDETTIEYEFYESNLLISLNGNSMTLAVFDASFPPLAWTDPSHLYNDDYEPDSSLSLATRISAASAIQHHYSAVCDDEDFFIFEAIEGTTYVIEAKAQTIGTISLDLTLSLYSISGDSVAYDDDQTTTNEDPKIIWNCGETGDYYFVVKKYWDYLDPGNSLDDEKGDYTIRVDVTKGLLKPSEIQVDKQQLSLSPGQLPKLFLR